MRRCRLRIHGRVQGVGYRDATRNAAAQLGVAGWVRNRRDGTVEAELHGSDDAVTALLDWAQRGPALARVERIDIDELPAAGASPAGFAMLPTE